MSKKVNNTFIIEKEEDDICEYCGTKAELRPYGKNRANICFECAMKDPETTNEMFAKTIEGVSTVVIKL